MSRLTARAAVIEAIDRYIDVKTGNPPETRWHGIAGDLNIDQARCDLNEAFEQYEDAIHEREQQHGT